jgi:hypothetical protein
VADPARPGGNETVQLVVDTEVLKSVISAGILEKLGIASLVELQRRLANGDLIRRRRDVALFRHKGRAGGAGAVFGEARESNSPDATRSESLGFGLAPIRRELTDLPLVL